MRTATFGGVCPTWHLLWRVYSSERDCLVTARSDRERRQEIMEELKSVEAQRERLNNYLILALLVLVLAMLGLLIKSVLITPVKTPRTSLERDIMDLSVRLRKNDRDDQAYFGLGLAYLKMGAYSKALANFKEAAKLKPTNDRYHFYLAEVYRQQGNYWLAEKTVQKALKTIPNSPALLLEQGRIALEQEKYDAAISSLRKAVRITPESSDINYYLALALEKKGDKHQAAVYYQQTLKYVPDHQEAKAGLKRVGALK